MQQKTRNRFEIRGKKESSYCFIAHGAPNETACQALNPTFSAGVLNMIKLVKYNWCYCCTGAHVPASSQSQPPGNAADLHSPTFGRSLQPPAKCPRILFYLPGYNLNHRPSFPTVAMVTPQPVFAISADVHAVFIMSLPRWLSHA